MFGDRNNVLIEPPAPATPVSGLPGSPGGGEGEIHLLDRLSVLYRYRKIVLSVILVVMVAGTVQTLTTTPEYRSSSSLRIEDDRLAGPGSQMNLEYIYGEADDQLATEIEILQSRDLIKTIVGTLDLANNPEFNGQDSAPTGLGAALSSMRARVMRPITALLGSGGSDEPANPATPATPPRPGEVVDPRTDQLVSEFKAHLTVNRGSGRLVEVVFVSRSPEFAARAANTLALAFQEQNLKRKTGQLDAALVELNAKIKTLGDRIGGLRQTSQAYLKDQNAAQLAQPEILLTLKATLSTELDRAVTARDQAARDYNSLKDVDPTNPEIDTFPPMAANLEVGRLRREVQAERAALERRRKDAGWGPANTSYTNGLAAIAQKEEELVAQRKLVVTFLKRTLESAEAFEKAQRNSLNTVQAQVDSLGTKAFGYEDIQRVLQAEEKAYAEYIARQSELSLQTTSTRNNVSIVNTAIVPLRPFKPDVSRNLLISLFIGFALAGMLAFGLDYLDDTIKTPEDITRKLRIPFLGLVPSVRGDKQPVLSGPVPHDFGEAYRALRTSLVFTSGGESTRIITCTSAQPLEGKTTTACNLAMVLAFGGSRVLLIDADMRRPGVHKALKITNTVGLSHLLVGQARVREAIQRTSDPNFCVMTAGRTPPNPSELLASERMKQLIANLKQGPFDWVVIDTPPVLAVTDAVILTPLVDGVTFVLGAEMTRRRLAERAVQMLMVSRPKVVGAVLNRVNFDRNKYYYSRYYGYQYKSYYGSSAGSSTSKA
jgi:capsular exopolysaccharide synthesis family protein